MITFVLDLHGETSRLEDVSFLLYPLLQQERRHLYILTPTHPVQRADALARALERMRRDIRLRLQRLGGGRTPPWQVIVLLRPSLHSEALLDGALVGQLACIRYTLLAPLKKLGYQPEHQWAIILDDLVRDEDDPGETEKRGRPLNDARAERHWYQDTEGYVRSNDDSPYLFTEAEAQAFDDKLVAAKQKLAKKKSSERTRDWLLKQLEALEQADDKDARAVRRHLSLAAFADQVAVMRLTIRSGLEADGLAWLKLAYVVLFLAGKHHLRQEIFDKQRAAILIDPRRLDVELDEDGLARALNRYKGYLERVQAGIAREDHRKKIKALERYTSSCGCHEDMAAFPFEPPSFFGHLFLSPDDGREDQKSWLNWLYYASDEHIARIIREKFPEKKVDSRRLTGTHNGHIAQLLVEQEEEIPRKARACFEQAFNPPGSERHPAERPFEEQRDGKSTTWTFEEEIDRRHQEYKKARDALAEVELGDPYDPATEEALRKADKRARLALQERPTVRDFTVHLAVGVTVLLIPHIFLLGAGATVWDYAVVLPMLVVLTLGVAYWVAVRLRRTMQERIRSVIRWLMAWRDAVDVLFKSFKVFIQALCKVRVARKNVELARDKDDETKRRNRQNDLHEKKEIKFHIDRAHNILALLQVRDAPPADHDQEPSSELDIRKPVEDNPCYWLVSYGTGEPPPIMIGTQELQAGEDAATRGQLLPQIPYPPGLKKLRLEPDRAYPAFTRRKPEGTAPGRASTESTR